MHNLFNRKDNNSSLGMDSQAMDIEYNPYSS